MREGDTLLVPKLDRLGALDGKCLRDRDHAGSEGRGVQDLDATLRGVDWELLKLQLQNDWLLLINSFGHWTRRLDQKFSEQHEIASKNRYG